MIVGTCMLKLNIYESHSLKYKRSVIKSIIGKIQSRFNVSIAEVDLNDTWGSSVIGFAYVSNEMDHVHQVISKVMNFVDEDNRVEIVDHNIEIM